MRVEIWSDVVCPWCHIGKRRLEAALAEFAHRDHVEVQWRSFELDPSAASATGGGQVGEADYADRLAAKYGTSRAGAQQMIDAMTATATVEGLEFRFDRAVKANTFDAHQVIHLAAERGVQDAVKERLLRAYFTEGEAVGDRAVLARLAGDAGLDSDEVRGVLTQQRYADAVRADEAEASALGISGVPFFVVDRTYGLSGAQPSEQILAVLQRSWSGSHPLTLVAANDSAAACGPDGCAT